MLIGFFLLPIGPAYSFEDKISNHNINCESHKGKYGSHGHPKSWTGVMDILHKEDLEIKPDNCNHGG